MVIIINHLTLKIYNFIQITSRNKEDILLKSQIKVQNYNFSTLNHQTDSILNTLLSNITSIFSIITYY